MKFEIKSRFSGEILFSVETETLKLAVEAAYKSGAYLGGANLGGANGLEKFPIQIGGHKHWLCTTPDGQLQIGCHVYSFEDWQEHAEAIGRKEGYSPIDVEIYKLHIDYILKISRLLWNQKAVKP